MNLKMRKKQNNNQYKLVVRNGRWIIIKEKA